MNGAAAAIGYFWGDDGYGLERAADRIAEALAVTGGGPVERWRTTGAESTPERIGERVATSTLFGGGCMAVISDPYPLIRARDSRNELIAVLTSVAPGNGIVFLDPMDRVPSKGVDAARQEFAAAIRAAGGEAAALAAPSAQALVPWIEARASERNITLERGAAAELARRLGGLVRDGDIDRRRQGQLAVAELGKLALLHLDDTPVSVEDVQALVAEAIPGSAFAFLDALGQRRTRETTDLLELLWEATPEPVVLVQVYNRIRQLLEVADRIAAGETSRQLSTSMKLHPYVLEKLVRQAHAWSVDELVAALDGLLELDIMVKSADASASSEQGRRLAFVLWVGRHVGQNSSAGTGARDQS